jgi:cobalt/nickel transport system ATP-binding protein
MNHTPAVLEIRELSFSYPGIKVLDRVSFSLRSGTLGLIGANGTGKSTILLLLSGLIRGEGYISILGQELSKKTAPALRKKLSFVFQNPDDQLFMPSVFENIAFGLENLTEQQLADKVSRALADVGMSGMEQRNASQLSLGQKKRICLAAAMARQPELYLFDEPTNELDPKGRRHFMDLIGTIDTPKILISHDLNMIAETCDDVLILGNSAVAAWGSVRNIMTQQKLMEDNQLEVPAILL